MRYGYGWKRGREERGQEIEYIHPREEENREGNNLGVRIVISVIHIILDFALSHSFYCCDNMLAIGKLGEVRHMHLDSLD
mmetsp:Transcript_9571/g.13169  ORF Transcript_9571/g.13169 Transcript_9571/m.13169 type:complete len:80 (-) Transcript_9571:1130-1369(-)